MVCKDKRKVWVNDKGHERRVLKCQNKAPPKRRARPIATPPRSPPRRRRIHISPPRATLPRFSATPPPEPRFSATPPPKIPHKKHPVENYG